MNSPEIDLSARGNLVPEQGVISNHWGKDGLFNKWCQGDPLGKDKEIHISHCTQE